MYTLNCKGRIKLVESPMVMGILNLTTDSFYEASRFSGLDQILTAAEKMIEEGADILDIGGQSTRPGAQQISIEEEMGRVTPAITALHRRFPETMLSIDSFYARVVFEAVQAGASIVNDISAGEMDPAMLPVVAGLQVPYICMHMRGKPETMQEQTNYEDLCREVLDFFIMKIEQCRIVGINDLIVDPGFGFSKTIAQNFELLRNLSVFKILGRPLMIGISRKSTIYKTLGIPVEEALNGTTVLNTIGLMQGASILRVHDVREAKETVRLFKAVF